MVLRAGGSRAYPWRSDAALFAIEYGRDCRVVGLRYPPHGNLGFWVDDLTEAEAKIDKTGGKYFMGRPETDAPTTFYEMKFRDPNGIILDATHLGWCGAVKDVTPADDA